MSFAACCQRQLFVDHVSFILRTGIAAKTDKCSAFAVSLTRLRRALLVQITYNRIGCPLCDTVPMHRGSGLQSMYGARNSMRYCSGPSPFLIHARRGHCVGSAKSALALKKAGFRDLR
jgi:hypothetical protein